ncbi:MAG TPA: amino acid adenylation domain-containing protein, partial [Steroidobacteraceae bacterium]|nr:amino acid adenylation domain-containing protein [Steroidobacteraceae bacterium]
MWLATQFFDTRDMFNFCAIIKMEGAPDKLALQHAVTEVVRRHATLRTIVTQQADGKLIQRVIPAAPAELTYVDLSADSRDPEAEQFLNKVFSERFQLDQDSLYRAYLIKLHGGRFKFAFITHHIASDGWSIDLLLREISEIYNARVEHRDAELKSLSIDFIDYAAWERSEAGAARLVDGLRYWRSRLEDVPGLHSLEMDKPRPLTPTFATQSFERWIDKELLKRLETYALAKGTTLFVVLMTAFAALCCRSARSTDIVIGTPIANRLREEVAPLIGLFMNMLAFRVTVAEQESFDQLLARCQKNYLQDIQHQGTPFDRVVTEVCGNVHDQRYAPLVQICFALHNNTLDDVSMRGLVCSTGFKLSASSQYDLNVASQVRKDGLYFLWQYSTDIFTTGRIEQLATSFESLLREILESPSRLLVSLLPAAKEEVVKSSSVDHAARMKLLQLGNDTARPFDQNLCVHHLFARQVQQSPNAIALVFKDTELTYAQLGVRVNQLASYLRSTRLIKADMLVGVYLPRSPELLISQLAIMQAGGAYLPLDPEYPLARLSYMIQDSAVSCVLTTSDAISQGLVTEAQALCWDDQQFLDALKNEPDEFCDHCAVDHGNKLAYVIYTSGSTGKPKGVMLEHKGLTNFLLAMQREPAIESSDRLLAITSSCFDIHTLEMYLPLIAGATVVMAAKDEYADPVELMRLVEARNITIMQATPTTWLTMLEAGWTPKCNIKCLCGGEALQPSLKNKLKAFPNVQLWNMYGPTETSVWSSVKRIHNDIAIGPPIANTTFYILDDEMEPVPSGVEGQLYIGGIGLARGYLNKPDLTDAAFIATSKLLSPKERIYRTGDSVKRLANGDIAFVGRVDNQVKIRGFRIEIGEIIASLEALAQVRQAAVVVKKRDDGSQYLAAFVVKENVDWEVRDALTAIAETLPEHMVPTTIAELNQLPLTPNGKVDLRALSTLETDVSSDAKISGSIPETYVQRLIAVLW